MTELPLASAFLFDLLGVRLPQSKYKRWAKQKE